MKLKELKLGVRVRLESLNEPTVLLHNKVLDDKRGRISGNAFREGGTWKVPVTLEGKGTVEYWSVARVRECS